MVNPAIISADANERSIIADLIPNMKYDRDSVKRVAYRRYATVLTNVSKGVFYMSLKWIILVII